MLYWQSIKMSANRSDSAIQPHFTHVSGCVTHALSRVDGCI